MTDICLMMYFDTDLYFFVLCFDNDLLRTRVEECIPFPIIHPTNARLRFAYSYILRFAFVRLLTMTRVPTPYITLP